MKARVGTYSLPRRGGESRCRPCASALLASRFVTVYAICSPPALSSVAAICQHSVRRSSTHEHRGGVAVHLCSSIVPASSSAFALPTRTRRRRRRPSIAMCSPCQVSAHSAVRIDAFGSGRRGTCEHVRVAARPFPESFSPSRRCGGLPAEPAACARRNQGRTEVREGNGPLSVSSLARSDVHVDRMQSIGGLPCSTSYAAARSGATEDRGSHGVSAARRSAHAGGARG